MPLYRRGSVTGLTDGRGQVSHHVGVRARGVAAHGGRVLLGVLHELSHGVDAQFFRHTHYQRVTRWPDGTVLTGPWVEVAE